MLFFIAREKFGFMIRAISFSEYSSLVRVLLLLLPETLKTKSAQIFSLILQFLLEVFICFSVSVFAMFV